VPRVYSPWLNSTRHGELETSFSQYKSTSPHMNVPSTQSTDRPMSNPDFPNLDRNMYERGEHAREWQCKLCPHVNSSYTNNNNATRHVQTIHLNFNRVPTKMRNWNSLTFPWLFPDQNHFSLTSNSVKFAQSLSAKSIFICWPPPLPHTSQHLSYHSLF